MSNLFHIQYIYLNYKMCYINDSNILFLISLLNKSEKILTNLCNRNI